MSTVPAQNQAPSERSSRIATLIAGLRAASAAGKTIDQDSVIAANLDLMPELKAELEKLWRVEAARKAAEAASSTQATTTAGGFVGADFDRPLIEAPGYTVLREINRGGQAIVYLARQLSTGRTVALKVMRDGSFADERTMARFNREIKILAALNHTHIVTIFDAGRTTDGSQFIVMNYVAGQSLDEYMRYRQEKDPNDPSRLLRMFLKICAAVNAAHTRGIVHRDLKPGNIRIDEAGEPKILDFGLARTPLDRFVSEMDQPLSITGEFLGSLPWASPEQAEGFPDRIDQRTDVYSLGVILYQMLTGGKFPYQVVGNMRDVLNNIVTAEPTPPSKVVAAARVKGLAGNRAPATPYPPAVNEAIEKIVLKALAKKPQQRYQSAGELRRDIANYLSGRPMTARAADPEARPALSASLRITAAIGVLFIGIATVVWGAVYLAHSNANRATGPSGTNEVNIAPLVKATALNESPAKPVPKTDSPMPVQQAIAPSQPPMNIAAPSNAKPSAPVDAVYYNGHRFKFFRQELGWNAAAEQCQQMGGHLATAQTFGRQAFLEQLKGEDVTGWVGGSADTKGTWTWIDGSPIPAERIEPGNAQFDGHRWMFIMRDGKLGGRSESGRIDGGVIPMVQGFICEWDE